MMSSKDVQSLVKELRGGFDLLHKKGQDFEDQVYSRIPYQDRLIANLSEEITTRTPLPSRRMSIEAAHAVGLLAQSLQYHIEPTSVKKRDERLADKLEVFFAHMGLTLVQPLNDAIARMQAVSPFAPLWLEVNPFALPKDDSKREEYRKSYSRYRLRVLDWKTCYFLYDDEGQPTIAGIEEEVPYVEVVKRYGSGRQDRTPLEICGEEFPFLRGGRGHDVETSDMFTKKAKVWKIDDGQTISHHVEVKGGAYEQVGYIDQDKKQVGDYPNYFGRPSLVLVHGAFNVDAHNVEDVFESLLAAFGRSQMNVDVLLSQGVSIAMNPPKRGQVLPETVALAAYESDKPVPAVVFKENTVASLLGPAADFKTEADLTLKDLAQFVVGERDAAALPQILTSPDPATVKNSTAAAFLNAGESANRILDGPRRSKSKGVMTLFKMITHDICEGWNKPGMKPEAIERPTITITGKELVKGKVLGERKGEELEMDPADFEGIDLDKTLEIVPGAMSQSQKAALYEYKRTQVGDAVATPEDLIEVEYEDVTGQMKKLEIFRRYQLRKPQIEKMGLIYDVEYIRKTTGMDFTWLLGQTPEMGGGQPMGGAPVGNGLNVGPTAQPPATSVPMVGA